LAKRLATYRTSRGHRTRARIHAFWAPIGQRARRAARLRLLAVCLVVLLLAGGVADAYAEQFLSTLPAIKGLDAAAFKGDTLVYDRSGQVLLADVGENGDHSQYATLKDVSAWVPKATIAIEDKNFYRNQGFDVTGIARSAYENLRAGRVVGGGSTITQQLAKQLFLTPEQSYTRKLKEIILAYQLSQTYSKDQILELYLNHSYYGQQAYGVEAAARLFFHKDAKDLDVAQSAMLAGLPQAPTRWNPIVHPAAAKARQLEVLQAMLNLQSISALQFNQAATEKLEVFTPTNTFRAPHFVDYVQDELRALGFKPGEQQLVVTSSLDFGKQQIGERVISDNLNANLWRDQDPGGLLDSAMVALDPKTAQILVMVGSHDYNDTRDGQINLATTPRNVGSSYKVFTYTAALNTRKVTMETQIVDGPSPLRVPQTAAPDYLVYNYDHGTHGTLPLREAFSNSLNIPAVKTELAVGVSTVVDFSRNIGVFPRDGSLNPNAPMAAYGPALTLGGYPITVLEEANGLATIADMGVYHQPEAILSVRDARGRILYQTDANATRRQAIDPGVTFLTAQILQDDRNRYKIFGPNSKLHLRDRTSAAKTGTSDDFKDATTIGFTPDLAAVIWIGDVKGITHTMSRNSDGIYVAAPAWNRFMTEALAGVPDKWYPQPADVVSGSRGGTYFLSDQRSVPSLPGDHPSPLPTPTADPVPPDPGTGPVPVDGAPPAPCPTPHAIPICRG